MAAFKVNGGMNPLHRSAAQPTLACVRAYEYLRVALFPLVIRGARAGIQTPSQERLTMYSRSAVASLTGRLLKKLKLVNVINCQQRAQIVSRF